MITRFGLELCFKIDKLSLQLAWTGNCINSQEILNMKNHLECGIFRSRVFNLIGLFSFNIYYVNGCIQQKKLLFHNIIDLYV